MAKKLDKDLDYYMKLPYTIEFIPYGDGSYLAQIQELAGCMTEGDTFEETKEMIEDAKKCWLESALEDNDTTIPEPTPIDYSGRFNVRVPPTLHERLTKRAKREGVSLNTFIATTLAAAV